MWSISASMFDVLKNPDTLSISPPQTADPTDSFRVDLFQQLYRSLSGLQAFRATWPIACESF